MNQIIINKVKIKKNRIDYDYSIDGEWKKYFNLDNNFFVEYSEDILDTPVSIAVIPFICNILPLVWLFDARLILEEIDKDFFESIPSFKKGYEDMFPSLSFKGEIFTNNIVDHDDRNKKGVATFFSGGVDAHQTLISHIEESPTLVTIWGADVALDDVAGWSIVEEHIKATSKKFNLEHVVIKSPLREFINTPLLTDFVFSLVNDGWWHGFQHGIGMIGLLAPYAYMRNIRVAYIAASFTIEEKGKVTCASDPTIDNFVKFCGCNIIHDGYDYSRQEKIRKICKYSKNNKSSINLRVCWESSGGSNCCRCEKCYRTILGIIAEKENPRKYGFDYSDNEFSIMMKHFKKTVNLRNNFRYQYIQNSFHENYTRKSLSKELQWFYDIKINRKLPYVSEYYRFGQKVIKKLSNIKSS